MADIFLSYAREDEERIHALVGALEARNWSVFWDRRIPPGQTWREFIGRELEAARCVVVAWSATSVASNWVAEEAEEARQLGRLVPVLLDAVNPPLGFRSVQAADLSGWHPGDASDSFERFAEGVATVLGRADPAKGDERTDAKLPPRRGPALAPKRSRWRFVLLASAAVALVVPVGVCVRLMREKPPIVMTNTQEPAPLARAPRPNAPAPGPKANAEANANAPAPSAAVELPFFLQRAVQRADLEGKSDWELDVMRNEIYARHGRRFDRRDLQRYFEQQPWYVPNYDADEFPLALLTALERSNVDRIRSFQEQRQGSK